MPVSMTGRKRSTQAGSALLVVAALLIVAGVMMSLGIGMFHTEEPVDRQAETIAKMEVVMNELSAYAQHNYSLPCPADMSKTPPTSSSGAGFGTAKASCAVGVAPTAANGGIGIVPFNTLGLSDSDARDGWGHYLTYAISPVFANPSAAYDTDIFYVCRTTDWIYTYQATDLPFPPPPADMNNLKARFCCPGLVAYAAGTDLVIHNVVGGTINPNIVGATRTAAGGGYGTIIPPAALDNGPHGASSATAWAVVLVSHGANGLGAFLGNGTTNQMPLPPAGSNEAENADNDNTFVDAPMILAPYSAASTNHFDDIVMEATQTQLYSRLNNATCARPWR